MISNQLIEIFGNERVQFNPIEIEKYLQNVCAAKRNILGIVYPQSENEIINLIQLARQLHMPLYPISTGHNYGLGSRLPVEEGHLIVDLSRMNRILSFDADLGLAHIEPGVSQQDIAQYLEKINADFILNVTGSSIHSSLVGNAIERGVGHYGSRVPEVVNLDIILGNGTKLATNPLNAAYPHGLGPDLKGLFFQSNFGIVTAMTLRLLPKTQSVAILTIEKQPAIALDVFIDQLRKTKQRLLLPENLHISNQVRKLSVVTPLIARQFNLSMSEASKITKERSKSDWSATVSLRGERIMLESQIQCVKNCLQDYANITLLFDSELNQISDPFLAALKGTAGHSLGIPCSDALLSLGYGLQQTVNNTLEESNIGTLFLIPVLPFKGQDFMNVVACVNEKFQQYAFEAYMTFNLVEQLSLEGVINLTFLKTDTKVVSTAHQCIQETFAALENQGYFPMRLSIFQKSSYLCKNKTEKEVKKSLKKMFDPDNIIARGRYDFSN